MKRPPAFQFYVDNFVEGTCDMTDAEVGFYVRLLCAQWTRGGLPNNERELMRFSRGSTARALARIKLKFELGTDGLLRNKRLEAERAKQQAWRDKSAVGGQRSANTRVATKGGSTTAPRVVEETGQPNGNIPVSSFQSPSPKDSTPTPFERFWIAYPRKTARAAAEKAFKKVRGDIDLILAAIERQVKTPDWVKDNGQFIPYPATWLNQRRWEDELAQAPAQMPANRLEAYDDLNRAGW